MADTQTAQAESAQALFCYIADVIGARRVGLEWTCFIDNILNNKYKTQKFIYPVFKKKYKIEIGKAFSSDVVNVSPRIPKTTIDKLLHDGKKTNPIQNGWFLSSLKVGKALIEDLQKLSGENVKSRGIQLLASEIANVSASGVSYTRGTPKVMGNIATLYKYANAEKPTFGDINKWNPADIYYATDKAKEVLGKKVKEENIRKLTFASLNTFIGSLMQSGDLLPLSLKKGVNKINLKPVNFVRSKEENLISSLFATGTIGKGLTGIRLDPKNSTKEFNFIGKRNFSESRDIQIKLEIDPKRAKIKSGDTNAGTIKIRHTPASGGKPSRGVKVELKYEKASALGGQFVGMEIFYKIVTKVDPVFGAVCYKMFQAGYTKFLGEMVFYKAAGGDDLYKFQKNSPERNQFNDEVGAISAILIMNKLIKYIASYFSPANCRKDTALQHLVIRKIFEYVTSRSKQSSPFVIAKD